MLKELEQLAEELNIKCRDNNYNWCYLQKEGINQFLQAFYDYLGTVELPKPKLTDGCDISCHVVERDDVIKALQTKLKEMIKGCPQIIPRELTEKA